MWRLGKHAVRLEVKKRSGKNEDPHTGTERRSVGRALCVMERSQQHEKQQVPKAATEMGRNYRKSSGSPQKASRSAPGDLREAVQNSRNSKQAKELGMVVEILQRKMKFNLRGGGKWRRKVERKAGDKKSIQ